MKKISSVKCFGGQQERWSHWSEANQCEMTFGIFLPDSAEPLPCLYWLSGLTCTDENFAQKSGAQRYAAELGLVLIMPDTSPRGEAVADDAEGAWDFGLGAGFYLNATQAPWSQHYNMYDYVVSELPDLINNHFNVAPQASISGHSMGGHGALTCALKNPDLYNSVSAFSPIVNPMQCPWGQKAFTNYLGSDRAAWEEYDACQLISRGGLELPLLVDQGADDNFLAEQLLTENLVKVLEGSIAPNEVRMQAAYDHSYFFVSSFIGEHLKFHHKYLTE